MCFKRIRTKRGRSNMVKCATREAFGLALKEIVEKNQDVIVLDADLSPATKTCYAKEARPQQFYSAGIAEANMVGMGAGLAASGLKPFVSSFAMFLAGRAFEQIRNSVAYPHLNVKLCATHAGITVGEDGATHQCLEDLALMRVLPGMSVLQPCDAIETQAMIKTLVHYDHPCYIRMSRLAVENVFDEDYQFEMGKIVEVCGGKKVALLATGIMVSEAQKALVRLKEFHITPALYNVHTLKPFDSKQLSDIAREFDVIVTLEEHNVIGGLYSCVLENLKTPRLVIPIAIMDSFGESGTPEELMKKYKIDVSYIEKTVKELWR